VISLVTANVNGVRAAVRRGGLAWLKAADPDIICLQEVRADGDQLTAALVEGGLTDWHVAHEPSCDLGRSGVAVLTKQAHVAARGLAGHSSTGRWVETELDTEVGPLTVVSAYVPTGETDTARQVEKYAFLDAMSVRLDELATRAGTGGGEAVITGDFNIAHAKADIKNWKGNLNKSGFLVEERTYLDRWFGAGWTDLGRYHGGAGPGPYTWWSWRGKAFDNDAGWRIDYVLSTPALAARSMKIEVGRAATYAERWSDHAPVTAWFTQ
jgi:exodeoxyribonuclease-3